MEGEPTLIWDTRSLIWDGGSLVWDPFEEPPSVLGDIVYAQAEQGRFLGVQAEQGRTLMATQGKRR